MSQEPTKMYDGFITQDSMPLAFDAAEEITAANSRYAGLPEDQKSIDGALAQLQENNATVLRALAHLELAVNLHAGDAFTGRTPNGSMTVDKTE